MKEYLILFVMGVLACGCREKTELQKSYAFSQKAGFVRMAEGMKQNVDKYYVPDYAKAYAFADSAIAHSPDNPHFYSMKAVWYIFIKGFSAGAFSLRSRCTRRLRRMIRFT